MATDRPARRCTICAASGKVLRFSLVQTSKQPDGRHTTRGAGRIDLCETCWATAQRQIDRLGRTRPRARLLPSAA